MDLNSNNVWDLDEEQIAQLWEKERSEEGFASSEEKLLNTIRLCFDVVHYNPGDEREVKKYETKDWATFYSCDERKGCIAVRRKFIETS